MELTLQEIIKFEEHKNDFYTTEEQELIRQLDAGKIETQPHDQVMQELKEFLKL
ncbi:hypothetical protein [Pasteurella atlantica]|uniref:Uncharacterized protein n=2 Tax=Pasteurellaceae TaxID=712 RepID=A0ACC6HNN2_9PAST|nr:hypothetical protein [Pasteurella atlantica]MDP8052482.1 hypothetical protein [Pasteurella atlantica]MDP8098639.1 hypothetical protein [Pasteurella atlantica]MDP8101015.1 hypothetical protein [Pasteurella atlantica]MDP8105841.1 hypothetical protein [Pasteurella atlantica]MDP8106669.1 hypothetical protein [Pasteurella atlantica]